MELRKIGLKTMLMAIMFSFLLCQYSIAAQQSTTQNSGSTTGVNGSDILPPSAPQGLSAVNRTYTSITLNWSKSSDNVEVKGYYVYRDGKKIITSSKTTYTSRDLIPGRQYTYSIKAYDAAGNVSASGEALCIAAVADSQPPTVPGSPFASSVSFNSITLSWKPSTDNVGVKRYEIYVCGTKKASTSATSYTCKSLSPERTYNFTIKAYDTAGNCSSSSSTVYANTLVDNTAPTMPYGLKASSITETEVSLIWSPSSDNVKVKGYEIYCDGKKAGTSSKTTYTSKKLIPGNCYKYTIKAIDTSGLRSAESTCLTITTVKDLKSPTTPERLKISSLNGSSVSLSWNVSSDNVKVKGYKLYCNSSVIATTTKTTRSVKNPGLGIGVYWVRAFDQSDNMSEKSNIVTVLTVK